MRCNIQDDDFVRRAVGDVSAALRDTAWGKSGWDEVCRRLTAVLPGSAVGIVNYDMPRKNVKATFADGIGEEFLISYRDYYAPLNPWRDYLATASHDRVHVAERDSPARAFSDSEFFNDWLAPQKNMDAGVATKVSVDPANEIHCVWHYGARMAPSYDTVAEEILGRLRPRVAEAVRGAAVLCEALEGGQRLGAMIERIEGAAMLVDRDRRISEANAEASAALVSGQVVAGVGDILSMRHPAAQRWLEEAVARFADGEPVGSVATTFSIGERICRVSLTPAPEHMETGFPLLLQPRRLVLVVVRLLVGEAVILDSASLHFAFGLSAAELRLCEVLVNGHSLARAAELLGVSDGTVRQRVKAVYHKTGTHRQGELIALLARFGAEN